MGGWVELHKQQKVADGYKDALEVMEVGGIRPRARVGNSIAFRASVCLPSALGHMPTQPAIPLNFSNKPGKNTY